MATIFYFSSEPPPDSMFSDIQTLNRFQDEQFQELVKIVFSFLNTPSKSTRLISQLEDFAAEEGVSAGALKNVVKTLLVIPNSAIKKNLGTSQIQEDLVNLGLSEEKAAQFGEHWKTNLLALSRGALGQTLMINQLVDMEWKFGVTAASNDVNQVGNTFLQLKMVINKGNGTENVHMELTLPQFYSFLHEMEKAKASLEYFT